MHSAVDPFDLPALFSMRGLIEAVDPQGEPAIAALVPPPSCRAVAVLPGSFNPPTSAHVLLAERALSDGFDLVVFAYARRTVGKERHGLIPEDRLLALRGAARSQRFAAAVCSHGLYADQAEAAARLFPGADIAFLVGSDKVIQIFEERWYTDREEALERLFSAARLVAAPRADQADELARVLRARRNRRWAGKVEVRRLHPAVSDLSSTRVRGLLRSGADPAGLVPAPVAEFLSGVRAFVPPSVADGEEIDAYHIRARLLDALWSMRRDGDALDDVDLRGLVDIATSASEAGRRLRALLSSDTAQRIDLDAVRAATA